MAAHLPRGTWVSLLFQYTPVCAPEDYPELNRRLTARECDKAFRYLEELGLTDGYVQERESAGSKYIPAFDLTGVEKRPTEGNGNPWLRSFQPGLVAGNREKRETGSIPTGGGCV